MAGPACFCYAARVSSNPASPHRLTLEEWADLEEDIEGELVDGRLEVGELPTVLHEAIVAWLLWSLRAWVAPLGGRVFGSELKLAVAAERGSKADLSAYLPGRALPGKASGATRRAPSIVVEVVSPRARDERRDVVDKKNEYASFGVSYYWIVNPRARTLEVFELVVRVH